MFRPKILLVVIVTIAIVVVLVMLRRSPASTQANAFRVEEVTISDLHRAIQDRRTTCQAVVQQYVDRARAFNGVCTALVTADGAPVSAAKGVVRAGAALTFPLNTVAVSSVLPNVGEYAGLPIEFGRMEPTLSDPSVQYQMGMRVGIPDAGQVNALETLNIRGERSVSCKASCDAHPSSGSLPSSCPAACDAFRRQPDALETAADLDRQYGHTPDLQKLPMYCVTFSAKNWYDAKDMRATGGNDVNFAMDAPKVDSPDLAELRSKGAIIYAVANATSVGGPTSPGPRKASSVLPGGNLAYGLWGGQPCNPYDTERTPRGTSSGSGVAVATNLVACSICEQTGGSCKGPASRNNVVSLLATKGVMMDGGLNQDAGDRAGIHCRTVRDAALVLDAAKGYKSRDVFTAIPAGLIPAQPYASFLVGDGDVARKPLSGMRIGVVREFMVKHTMNDVAISDQIDKDIKTTLRDRLGAELVESVDPLYPDDPAIPNMKYTFQDAFADILPQHVPEYFWQTTSSGDLEFAVPGHDVRTVEYLLEVALRTAPLSGRLNLRRIASGLGDPSSPFVFNKYLRQRGDARITDWASWVANAKWRSDAQRVGAENAIDDHDPRQEPGTVSYMKMQSVLRLIVLKVMRENGIDVFVNPENTLPPYTLGGPTEPIVGNRDTASCCMLFTALLGGPEIDVPAGYTRIVYEPRFILSPDKRTYDSVTGTVQSLLPHPMPISLMLWAGPGADWAVIKAASAYEAATHHRVPPPAFGPIPGNNRGKAGGDISELR